MNSDDEYAGAFECDPDAATLNDKRCTDTYNGYESEHCNAVRESEFGNFQETYDWIECESTSYPGKKYFFNLSTRCSTWTRPLPMHVHLQCFTRKSRIYNYDFTCDLDNPLMIISSENEDDNKPSSVGIEEKCCIKTQRNHSGTLSPLYDVVAKDEQYRDHNFNDVPNDFCARNNCFELHRLSPFKIPKSFPGSETKSETESNSNRTESCAKSDGSFRMSDFIKIPPRNEHEKPDVRAVVPEKSRVHAPPPSCVKNGNHSIPGSQKIRPVKKQIPRGAKKVKNTICKQAAWRNRKPRSKRIICEMYGTRTINYNASDCGSMEPLPGVKCTRLSDTSVSSAWGQVNVKPTVPCDTQLPDMCFNVHLSSTSSCSCSSTCTCCSTSSGTNSTTSTSTCSS